MAIPERDTVTTSDGRTIYSRETSSTGWFVGIIVLLALLAIGYLVFSANSHPSTTSVDINNTPAITSPATDTPAMAPAQETPQAAPMVVAPATDTPAATPAPDTNTPAPVATPATPDTTTPAPVTAPAQ
jgi:hypothetical protein